MDGHATMALCGSDANDINPHAQELCHEGMTRLVMCDAYPFRVGQLVHPATRFRRLPSSASRWFFSVACGAQRLIRFDGASEPPKARARM